MNEDEFDEKREMEEMIEVECDDEDEDSDGAV